MSGRRTGSAGLLAAVAFALGLSGCVTARREPPRPASTTFGARRVSVPAEVLDNHLIVVVKWDKYGPYRFLVDTGSNVTLVTPELAQRYAARGAPLPEMPQVPVQSADGRQTELPAAVLGRIELGQARFADVPVLVYDCAALSDQLGVRIDGVLGFPLFRETLLTLDYPNSRVILQPATAAPPQGGSTLPCNDADRRPVISVRLSGQDLDAQIDSGLDEAFSLDTSVLAPKFAYGPAVGPTVGTLAGDHVEELGRVASDLVIGDYAVPRPIVELVDDGSKIGGGILKYFTVTFDQERGQVTFFRDATDPIAIPGRRSVGLSFRKTPAYWRVVGVVPGSPAALAGARAGDLVIRINDEPVFQWGVSRYERLMANAEEVTYTFLRGTTEADDRLRVVELVP